MLTKIKFFLGNKVIDRMLFLIGFIAFFQPYMVLILHYGRSNNCLNCPILFQTFFISLIYLFFPMALMYIGMKLIKLNSIIQGVILLCYYIPVSFVKLTIPLFDDRIAAWSTYSDEEIWNSALMMSIPSFFVLSIVFLVVFVTLNKKNVRIISKDK
jgi:hypothetical protein